MPGNPEVVHGFKRLTVANRLDVDPIMERFVRLQQGVIERPSGRDWADLFLRLDLDHKVPGEVRALFSVARAAMVYGFYFYPLYTLGLEQMYRVADAATIHRCNQLIAPPLKSFRARIRWLRDRGILSEVEAGWWDTIRRLRNIASHPRMQSIGPPGVALSQLRRLVVHIDALFDMGGEVAANEGPATD